MRYDENTVVYERLERRSMIICLSLLLLSSSVLITVYQTLPAIVTAQWRPWILGLFVVYPLLLLLAMWNKSWVFRFGSVAAVTPDGLLLRTGNRPMELILWSAIAKCTDYRLIRVAVVACEGRGTLFIGGVFRSATEPRSFTAEVNRRCGAIVKTDRVASRD